MNTEIATLDNTVFYSIAEYHDPDKITAPLRRTANHFGIPLEFAIYGEGEKYRCNSETKFNKVLPFLEKQYNIDKRYCLFCDARDVVFADTAHNILQEYNAMNISGVLFNSNSYCGTWPCEVVDYTEAIVKRYSGHGVVNSGVYIGKITDVINLIHGAINIIEALRNGNFDNPSLSYFSQEIKDDFRENKDKYSNSDQFAIQTLQTLSHQLIKVDTEKRLLAVFGEKYPFVRNRLPKNCYAVNWSQMGDDCYIGNAKVLHSPWLSKNTVAWNSWVDEEILQKR